MSSEPRPLQAKLEPPDPIVPQVCSVDRIAPECITDVFDPYGSTAAVSNDQKFVAALEDAVRSEEWIVFRATYRTYLSSIWKDDHYVNGAGTESAAHEHLKIVAAEFLDRCGHRMPKDENCLYEGASNHASEWIYSPDVFEVGYAPGIADVACHCTGCNTYVEAGHMSAEKLLKARDTDADTVIVTPYCGGAGLGRRGSEHQLYLFHRGSRFKGK